MLDSGALPMTDKYLPGDLFSNAPGKFLSIELMNGVEVAGTKNFAFPDIKLAINVPWGSFVVLLKKPDGPSGTKFSPPMTEPSESRLKYPGRTPESITATMIPLPVIPAAWSCRTLRLLRLTE